MRINDRSLHMQRWLLIAITLFLSACIADSTERQYEEAFSEKNFVSIELDEFEERTGIDLPTETLLHGYVSFREVSILPSQGSETIYHYAKLMIERDAFVEWIHQIYPYGFELFDDDARGVVGDNYGLWTPQDGLPLPTGTTSIENDSHKYKRITLSLGYRELQGDRWVLVWLNAF